MPVKSKKGTNQWPKIVFQTTVALWGFEKCQPVKYIRADADRLRLARLAWYFPLDISNASINWSINGEWVSRLGLVISITSISISRFCAANELRTVSVIRLGLTASTLRSMDDTKSTLPQRADRTWRSGFSAEKPSKISTQNYCKDLQAIAKKPCGPVVVSV